MSTRTAAEEDKAREGSDGGLGSLKHALSSSKDMSYTVGLRRREAENLSNKIPPNMCELARSSFIVGEDVDFIVEKGPKDHARIANKDSEGSRVFASLQQKLD